MNAGIKFRNNEFGQISQNPISREEIKALGEEIKNIINPPKQEPLRQDGNNLARNVDLF